MPDVQLLIGDTRATLASLPAASVQTCITSPPYYGLRDYGAAGQIGLEGSVDAYVAALVDVFRAVRRVLRPDGTLWLNLGDSYTNAGQAGSRGTKRGTGKPGWTDGGTLGDKQLLGIPWRVAFALQADGWILRSDIIWAKPNAMPESVTDRPTKAHEYLFLLAPSARYYYDADAIRENVGEPTRRAASFRNGGVYTNNRSFNNSASAEKDTHGDGDLSLAGRNKRTVWTVATRPYKGAHFATFPPDLIRPCVLAGTSAAGQCAACGSPWARVTEQGPTLRRTSVNGQGNGELNKSGRFGDAQTFTLGWQPTCRCDAGAPVPQTVLDPFAGSGTTGAVALEAGRAAVLCELNPAYAPLIRARLATVQPTLVQEGAA